MKNPPPVLAHLLELVSLLWKILFLFLAAMAPLMFLVGTIVALDRWGTHTRFLRNLQSYGKIAQAKVSYIDDEYNRAGLDFLDSQGKQRYGTLDLRYYHPEVTQTIQPKADIRIIYIDALISESEKTALADHYVDVQSAPPVSADVWWILGISWALIAIKPQFVFLGTDDFDKLLPIEKNLGTKR